MWQYLTGLGLYCRGRQMARNLSVDTATTIKTLVVIEMFPRGQSK